MELFGYSLETIYLFGLIIGGGLTFLYILFGDFIEGVFDAGFDGSINPTVVLAFVTMFSAFAYILERWTSIHSIIVFLASSITALILVTLLNVFVLIPLSQAEATMAYSDEDLRGRLGKVITSIPVDGFGEVMIPGKSGNIAKTAASFDKEAIAYDTEVLVIEVENGVLFVSPHESLD